MPQCKKCNKSFPNRIIIDGKERNLSKRKFCLGCSPFNKHNTKSLENSMYKNGNVCICASCNKEFEYQRASNMSHYLCSTCNSTKNRYRRKIKCIEYKGGKCIICGYSKSIFALGFHHINPLEKNFQISGHHDMAWNKLKLELDKCVLLCLNCHAEIHANNTDIYKFL
ncbi:MAG: HNH endonuclease [Patescibacteria group bacterium]|jgi:hypothetical protein